MNAFINLFNLWQDVCFPGLNRPFKLKEYVSNDRIILADTRQGNAALITSIDRMRSDIERRQLENRLDSIQSEVETSTKKMKETADASARKEEARKINELTKESHDIRDKMDDIGK
jgi:uncharacterized membrane protein